MKIKLISTFTLIIGLNLSLLTASSASEPNRIAIDYKNSEWVIPALNLNKIDGLSGKGITIAVVDTGADYQQNNINHSLLEGYSTLTNKALNIDNNIDEVGHGTHVAGIIASDGLGSAPKGIAPSTKIIPIQVLSTYGGTDESVSNGIEKAINLRVNIINLSLGGEVNPFSTETPLTCKAIERAYQANIVVVVAAGNSAQEGNPLNQPASCPHAISVAAVNKNLNPTSFSSFDQSVTIAAPGEEIASTLPNDFNSQPRYEAWSGTSMATPVVSATIALYLEKYPNSKVDEVISAIENTAIDLGSDGKDAYTGYGLINPLTLLTGKEANLAEIRNGISEKLTPVIEYLSYVKNKIDIVYNPVTVNKVKKIKLILNFDDNTQIVKNLPSSKNNLTFIIKEEPSKITSAFLLQEDKVNNTLYSNLYQDIVDATPLKPTKINPDLTSLKVTYKGEKILISYKINPPFDKNMSLTIFNDDINYFDTIEFKGSAKGEYLYTVKNPIIYEHALSISLTSPSNTISEFLEPKYLVALNSTPAIKGTTISISASFLCIIKAPICKKVKAKLYIDGKMVTTIPLTTLGEGFYTSNKKLKNIKVTVLNYGSRLIK